MNKAALILIQVLIIFMSTGTANRIVRDIEDDINDALADADKEIQGFVLRFYGASCVKQSQCLEYVAYCDKKAGLSAALGLGVLSIDGQCRPVIWVWIVLAVIILLLLGTCICFCLSGLCSCLYKCLFCCWRDTPANTPVKKMSKNVQELK